MLLQRTDAFEPLGRNNISSTYPKLKARMSSEADESTSGTHHRCRRAFRAKEVCDLFTVTQHDRHICDLGRRETVIILFSSKGDAMMRSISCTIRSNEFKYQTSTTVHIQQLSSSKSLIDRFCVLSSVSMQTVSVRDSAQFDCQR